MTDSAPPSTASSASASAAASAAAADGNPQKLGYDPAWYTWSAFFRIITNRAEPDDMARYMEAKSIINEQEHCRRCDAWRDWLLEYSPTVRFMDSKISQIGGPPMDASNIRCRRCPSLHGRKAGAFDGEYGILLCANHLRSRSHTEDVLSHEMVHAYDFLRFDWDKRNLKHSACAEIRATMLSGECRWSREFFDNHQWKFTNHFQACVRRQAVLSLTRHPLCDGPDAAARAVNAVWGSCFGDTRPFDEIYR